MPLSELLLTNFSMVPMAFAKIYLNKKWFLPQQWIFAPTMEDF